MSNTAAIRAMLHSHPDGIRAREIHDALPGISRATTIMRSLHRMPDAYIEPLAPGARSKGPVRSGVVRSGATSRLSLSHGPQF